MLSLRAPRAVIVFRHGHASGFINGYGRRHPKRTPRQVQKEIQAMSKAAKKINKSAATARKFLREHGFITKDNKVSAHIDSAA